MKLCDLIDALAEQLDREEISVGVATEIAKYDAAVQQEVYEEHFSDGCRTCHHNTANQILFKDECAEGCADCQNRSSMMHKNDEYLVQRSLQLVEGGPADGPCHGGRYARFGD